MSNKARSVCFTINNFTDVDSEQVAKLAPECKYLISAQEGAQATPHLQGYAQFKHPKSLKALSHQIPRAHLEISKGTPQQASDYCKKEGNFTEWGTLPQDGGSLEVNRWKAAKASLKAGLIDDVPDDIYLRYYRTCKEVVRDHMKAPGDLPDVCGHWYWGKPGTGKSRGARSDYPGSYLKMCNKWWDGYQNEPTVIIDDFEKSHVALGHHLKIWADRYSFLAEVKASALHIRPLVIVVTSNYTPDEIWSEDPVLVEAILRRFKVKDFNNYNSSF